MSADSKSASPSPDDEVPPPEQDVFDDENSIDLGQPEEVEEGASALSFSGRGGPRSDGSSSGGSSSGVRSWEQLVRETASDSDSGKVHYGAPLPPDVEETASDKDLLREVLAGEPPPSDIILKDPSNSYPALPRPVGEQPVMPFVLPPDLAATRPEDSSILGTSLPTGPGQSGFTSDVWGSSSGVDLRHPGPPANMSSGSLQRTEEIDDAQFVSPPSGDSSQTLLGDIPEGAGHDESSAVDLGSHGAVDLPFPLGADSTLESARKSRSRQPAPSGHGPGPESGTVDLLAAGEEFDLGLSDVTTSPSWVAAREDLPPTVPMVPAGKARLLAWAGGGAAGLLAGVAVCAGLWFAGVVPNQSGKSTTTATVPPAELAELREQVQSASRTRDEEAKKAAAATAESQRVRDQLALATKDLTQARTAAAQAQQARERADALALEVKQAETAQAALKDSVEKLTAGKTTADAKLREVDANLSTLRERLARAEADARTAKEQSEVAEAARKQSAAFAADLAQRLRMPPTAPPAELLAALDRALTRSPGETVTAVPTRPTGSAILTPNQVQRAFWAGVNAYRVGNFAAAEHEFARLAMSPEANAVHFYYLGLAQWKQGRSAEAIESFHRGWALERDSHPPPGEVERYFERLDRADHEAVNQFRR